MKIFTIIGVSLSKPHSDMESGAVVHAQRTAGLPHTTVVWYGG